MIYGNSWEKPKHPLLRFVVDLLCNQIKPVKFAINPALTKLLRDMRQIRAPNVSIGLVTAHVLTAGGQKRSKHSNDFFLFI